MRRLVVNADDLGYDPAVSEGLVHAMRAGVVGSATLMVNLPASEHGARLAHGLAVGLHLNLARGAPVSPRWPGVLLSAGRFDEALLPRVAAHVVEDEAEAQLDRAARLLGRPATHVDVHRHLHRHPAVLEGVARAAARRGLPVRALDAAMRARLRTFGVRTTDHFVGDAASEPYWTRARFLAAIDTLPAGTTELMCHPGWPPTTLSSGYGAQRAVELATLTSQDARAALERAGVALVTFADV